MDMFQESHGFLNKNRSRSRPYAYNNYGTGNPQRPMGPQHISPSTTTPFSYSISKDNRKSTNR
jgi:hypothetical protein